MRRHLVLLFAALALCSVSMACDKILGIEELTFGGDGTEPPPSDAAGGGERADAAGVPTGPSDANSGGGGPNGCTPGVAQCSNCIDDDGDGYVDGFDPECSSANDDAEHSFATGIPGDNIDSMKLDCFFDGNSGSGDDGCSIAPCCVLDPGNPTCPSTGSCTPAIQCLDYCERAATPGCDCFGCCTVCDGPECHTVMTHPAVAPDCSQENIADPAKCPTCTPVLECSNPCDPATCILCPGQTVDDLQAHCEGEAQCGGGNASCTDTVDCPMPDQYCSQGCCVAQLF